MEVNYWDSRDQVRQERKQARKKEVKGSRGYVRFGRAVWETPVYLSLGFYMHVAFPCTRSRQVVVSKVLSCAFQPEQLSVASGAPTAVSASWLVDPKGNVGLPGIFTWANLWIYFSLLE